MDVNLNIEEKELDYIKEYLTGKVNPVDLHDIANRLALFKTRDDRSHRVKIYNPNCEYKVGDLIYKEYPGNIPIGSKKFIEITEGVVLKVVGVRTRFGINEIQLKYEGTSDFKKYTSYLERQKIELLLPHKQAKPAEKAEYLAEDIDPRKQLDPLEKRDFSSLSRKLAGVLNKDPEIALISHKALLKINLKTIDNSVFDRIKEFLKENKNSETTEFLVENFVKIPTTDENFDAYCFALNYKMQIDYKIDFQQTQNIGWGKWNLISVIYYMKKNSTISDDNPLIDKVVIFNKKNMVHRRKKFEDALFPEGDSCTRYVLTQREITAGAIRLKPGFFDLGDSIEIELIDPKQKKSYTVFYYQDVQIILGLKEIFDRYKALQGTILTFEMVDADGKEITTGPGKLHINIRTTKKGTIADHIEYYPEKKAFNVLDEKVASTVFVNKSMFLEATVFKALFEKIDEFRKVETFNKLVHKVFLEFGIKERNYEIHILRLYHILDLIFPVNMKMVEETILGNDEFVPDEKLPGLFYLDSDAVVEIEEEEVKRKEIQIDESKKIREELRKTKLDQEKRIKDDIRKKREERRKKREQEMWEKERLITEHEDKKAAELKRTEPDGPRKSSSTPSQPYSSSSSQVKEASKAQPVMPDELANRKEQTVKWDRKKAEPEKEMSTPKPSKKSERKSEETVLSNDEIKREIEFEKLKETMSDRTAKTKGSEEDKKKVAYKDSIGGFGGSFASKLDQIVKKEEPKETKK